MPTTESAAAAAPITVSFPRRAIGAAGWICLVFALATWLLLRWGDLWSPATMALFAPSGS